MSALTRDLQFEEEGNCHPSILSMNIYSGPKMCYSWGSLLSITEMNEAELHVMSALIYTFITAKPVDT